MTLNGALNQDSFAAYLDQVPGPALRPGDVVVRDNLRVHEVTGICECIEARGRYFYPCTHPILALSKTAGAS